MELYGYDFKEYFFIELDLLRSRFPKRNERGNGLGPNFRFIIFMIRIEINFIRAGGAKNIINCIWIIFWEWSRYWK